MFADIGGFSARDLRASDGVYRRWLQPRLRSKRAFALVAEVRGTIVGSAVVWLREDQPRPGFPPRRIPYIMSVYVEPGSRGLGVATRLTEALIE
ncbi:MAG: GNAT family N-acetyltransferase, partial [Thermoplasmata archaeon]|nr:GNAT family N-acetyltransferase [Thermoplasmata archaeon]